MNATSIPTVTPLALFEIARDAIAWAERHSNPREVLLVPDLPAVLAGAARSEVVFHYGFTGAPQTIARFLRRDDRALVLAGQTDLAGAMVFAAELEAEIGREVDVVRCNPSAAAWIRERRQKPGIT